MRRLLATVGRLPAMAVAWVGDAAIAGSVGEEVVVSSSRMAKLALAGLNTTTLLMALLAGRALAGADEPLVRVSSSSPFADCPSAGLDGLLPTGEVEPVVVADPTDPDAAVTAWPQDRFRGSWPAPALTVVGPGGGWWSLG